MVAHRGVSGIETENTVPAFLAAANRSYFGIETDVRKSKDGFFVLMHDDTTKRVSDTVLSIADSDFSELRSIQLNDLGESSERCDLRVATLKEYITVCKKYEKIAVLEIKKAFCEQDIYDMLDEISALGYLDGVIFIAFDIEYLHYIRSKYPNQTVQFLTSKEIDGLVPMLESYGYDLDIYYKLATKELIDECHAAGIKVNVWTVDEIEDAERLIGYGIDYITSNIIE
jgi:glycerophosphoryl diester phosphodiesterase